jgi:glycosyltransferase involved in cell wall biosynthesis
MKILHIAPHLGGGVGSTILGYLSVNKSFEHEVVALGYSKDFILSEMSSLKVPYTDEISHSDIINKIPNFDIVLIHQWNHPLLYNFLVKSELPACRVVMLGHNSGFNPPNCYTKKILEYPDIFVFTTPLSYDVREVKSFGKINSMYDVWSTDGVEEYKDIKTTKHKGFVVGYIGTVDYAKIHPDFLEMCKAVSELNIPQLKFIVVGGSHESEFKAEAEKLGIGDKITFTGYVPKDELNYYLSCFDVFGYPLAPYHYGTCDLVLQLAMATGVVPVVFDNPMEKYMIKNKKTGLIVKDKKGYIQAIKDLYNNINWRKELGDNARKVAVDKYSLNKLDKEWEVVFSNVLDFPKTPKKWNINRFTITPEVIFLESIGNHSRHFKSDFDIIQLAKNKSWQTESKGSVHNYYSYFPFDRTLMKWSTLMRDNR